MDEEKRGLDLLIVKCEMKEKKMMKEKLMKNINRASIESY